MIRNVLRNPHPGLRDYASLACFIVLYGALLALAAAPASVAGLFAPSTALEEAAQ